MEKLDELLEQAQLATEEAFAATVEAEKLIYAAPLTTLKVPIVDTHSSLLSAHNELKWIRRQRAS